MHSARDYYRYYFHSIVKTQCANAAHGAAMEPLAIQFMLKANGYGMSDVAREFTTARKPADEPTSITPVAVRMVIFGASRSARIERRIAAITGKPLAELWPQWYGPNRRRRRRKLSEASQQESLAAVQALLSKQATNPATNGA